jgi:hypothetical protein
MHINPKHREKETLPDIEKPKSIDRGLHVPQARDRIFGSFFSPLRDPAAEGDSRDESESEAVDDLAVARTCDSVISEEQVTAAVRSDIHIDLPTSSNDLTKSFRKNAKAIYAELDKLSDSRIGLGSDILDPRFNLSTTSDALSFTGTLQVTYMW